MDQQIIGHLEKGRHSSMIATSQQKLKNALKVYFIMGSTNCNGRCPKEVLSAAIKGGITMFQFREKREMAR